MSYDIDIWSNSIPEWESILPNYQEWKLINNNIIFEMPRWQIVIGPESKVLEEDIPDEIIGQLPGIQYLIGISLEPINAPLAGHKLLQKVINRIAKNAYGVVHDLQQDKIFTPRGIHRVKRESKEERVSVLDCSWWFTESHVLTRNGIDDLLSLIEKYLPEAFPRRFGEYEPPQYLYSEYGKNFFIDFLSGKKLAVIWYPHYPVLDVWFGISSDYGPTKIGYKVNHFSVDIDASILDQPGWRLGLERCWVELSKLINPFYGEVRLRRNYIIRRGKLYLDKETDSHPIMNGWWNGLPSTLGQAVVIGEPYTTNWYEFTKRSEKTENLYFLSVDDWQSKMTVDQLLGGVPKGLVQGTYRDPLNNIHKTVHSEVWPFEYPFSDD